MKSLSPLGGAELGLIAFRASSLLGFTVVCVFSFCRLGGSIHMRPRVVLAHFNGRNHRQEPSVVVMSFMNK